MSESSRQADYLQAMGIQAWVRRTVPVNEATPSLSEEVTAPPVEPLSQPEPRAVPVQEAPTLVAESAPSVPETPVSAPRDVSRLGWPQLRSAVSSCTTCVLHESRTQTVFGVGDEHAQWMIIGEAPGADEDAQGEPFVGRAGKLLDNMLLALGLQREQVYIANILKCRPPNNRDPRPEEIAACEGFLRRQVALIQPKVILAVGRIAAHNLLKSHEPLGRMRGEAYQYEGIPVVVTYHPAYLLRTPRDKGKAWDDLKFARRLVQQGEVL